MDITKYLINTAPRSHYKELGIFKFAKDFFPERFTNDFVETHYDLIQVFFELYSPERHSREERKGYGIVHREAAKTTLINFLLPIYIIYTKGMPWYLRTKEGLQHEIINSERFILIASETIRSAELFSMEIRATINKRADLSKLFGEKSPREIPMAEQNRKGEQLWRRSAFLTTDDTAVVAVGTGQQVRGIQIGGSRPTVLIMDDMFSNKSTVTEVMRNKVRNFIDAELMFTVDSIVGKTFLANTIVHKDTHAYEVTKDTDWYGIEKPIIGVEDFQNVIDTLKKDENGHYIIPSYHECMEIQKNIHSLSWKERHPLHSILKIYRGLHKKGDATAFWREYLNITRSPEATSITEANFVMTDFEFDHGVCSFKYEGYSYRCKPKWQIGVDLASSEAEKRDDACITVSAHVQAIADIPGTNNIRYKTFAITCHVEGGKYNTLPNPESPLEKNYVDSLIKIYKKVGDIGIIYMEQNGQQGGIISAVRQGLKDRGYYFSVQGIVSAGNKIERITTDLRVWIALHNKILIPTGSEAQKLKNQSLFLGEMNHDDYPDSLSMSTKGLAIRPQESHELQQKIQNFFRSDQHTQAVPSWQVV